MSSIIDTFLTSHIAGRRERDKQEEVAPQSTWDDVKGILPVLQHGHSTVQAMLVNISLQSCSSGNMQNPAVNWFCFNRPDNKTVHKQLLVHNKMA